MAETSGRLPPTEDALVAERPAARRRWAWALGFCLPLSGGLPLSRWIPAFIDQSTPIRLVTAAAIVWLMVTALRVPKLRALPVAPRRMALALSAALAYAAITLIWTQNRAHGIHDLLTIGAALATAFTLLWLVRGDRWVLSGFAAGVLWAGGVQVVLAIVELITQYHFSTEFGSVYVLQGRVTRIEQVYGPIAFGTMGNPNDFGGLLLLTFAVFVGARAYGLVLGWGARVAGWIMAGAAILIGLGAMNDARGFRLSLLLVAAIYLLDRVLPKGPVLWRIPCLVLLGVVALALTILPLELLFSLGAAFDPSSAVPGPPPPVVGESDNLRLTLIARAVQVAISTFGFGRGLGTERAMIDSDQIPLNFHNVVAQLAAELGIVIALAFVVYLLVILSRWAFLTRFTRARGLESSRAAAVLALVLVIYGLTASGVLDSPLYWTFFVAIPLLTMGAEDSGVKGYGFMTR